MELSGTINRSITLSGSMIARGLDGRGIVSIAKTGTSGLVDTYTITYTDATTSTFTVTNGANGQITATSFAEEFSSSKAYAAGDYVVYSGQLYQFTTAHAAGAWNASHATAVQIADQVSELKSAITDIAGYGDSTTDYQLEINTVPTQYTLKTNNINDGTELKIGITKGNAICLPYFRPSGYKQNGLTFTINDDGSITVNGTASADTTYNIAYYTNPALFTRVHPTQGRQYGGFWGGCTDGSESTYYLKNVASGHVCYTTPVDTYGGRPSSGSAINLALVVKSGVTLTNKTFYPQLSLTGEEPYAPPITPKTATVESGTTEYQWENVTISDGDIVISNLGNTLTLDASRYYTFDEVQSQIDALNEMVGNPWVDKKWVAFGTSITDNWSQNSYITQGEHAGEHTGKYVPYLLEMSKLSQSSFVNRGIAGGSINGHILYYIRYYTSDEANADLITIEGAVNDFATSVPLGNVGDTVPYTNSLLPDSTAEGTFAGACYQAFTTALTNAPNAVVVLLTETTGKYHVGYANYYQLRKNDLGLYQSDYIEMTMKVAEFVGIPVINCGRDSMINAQNPQYIADHIHHTYLGGYQYAQTIWAKLRGIPLKALTVPE